MPTWQILIPTIPHRHDKLVRLLDQFAAQIQPGVQILVYRDNLEAAYGPKCQALLDSSNADYVSFLSDDDGISPDFVARITDALEQNPDYVGYRVRFTEDGGLQLPVVHSLAHPDWGHSPSLIYRDITHFNPIRRDIAMHGVFFGHEITDRDWADAIRATGLAKTEVFIDDEILYYQHTLADFILTQRSPMPPEQIPARATYPFVRYIGEKEATGAKASETAGTGH